MYRSSFGLLTVLLAFGCAGNEGEKSRATVVAFDETTRERVLLDSIPFSRPEVAADSLQRYKALSQAILSKYAPEPIPLVEMIGSVDSDDVSPITGRLTDEARRESSDINPMEEMRLDHATIGPDDRGVPSQQYPYVLIGKLIGLSGHCTASLVGPRHILTAAHCFEVGRDGYLEPTVFVPYYDRGVAPFGAAEVMHVYYGAIPPPTGSSQDFAIAVLERRLGEEMGAWFGIWAVEDSWLARNVQSPPEFIAAGYSGDWYSGEVMGADWGAWLYGRYPEDNLVVEHDGDTAPGASGGPVFTYLPNGGWYIVGVNIAGPRVRRDQGTFAQLEYISYEEAYEYGITNLATDTGRLYQMLRKAHLEFP